MVDDRRACRSGAGAVRRCRLLKRQRGNADVQYQWTAEVNGNTVLKDTDADLPSSGFNDQNSQDVVGAAGMHAFGFLADDQNNGESTITMKLANTSNANDVKTTIVVKATVQNGTFTDVSVQE